MSFPTRLYAEEWKYDGEIKFSVDKLPQFDEFADGIYPPKTIAEDIDFSSHDGAWSFRTRLRRALKTGPNFAGKYKIMTHGCGTSCQVNWIIDVETGQVIENLGSSLGVAYRLNSRLLIVHPPYQEILGYNYTSWGDFGDITFYEFIASNEENMVFDENNKSRLYKLLKLKSPNIEWDSLENPRYNRD